MIMKHILSLQTERTLLQWETNEWDEDIFLKISTNGVGTTKKKITQFFGPKALSGGVCSCIILAWSTRSMTCEDATARNGLDGRAITVQGHTVRSWFGDTVWKICGNTSHQENQKTMRDFSTWSSADSTKQNIWRTTGNIFDMTTKSRRTKLLPAPKSLTSVHEVMNQLWTPNPHSVIASNVEMCRSTPLQPCPNPFLLNQVRVSEPEAEHKTQSVW